MSSINGLIGSLEAIMRAEVVARIAQNLQPNDQEWTVAVPPPAPAAVGQERAPVIMMTGHSTVLADASDMDLAGSSLMELGLRAPIKYTTSSTDGLTPRIIDHSASKLLDLDKTAPASAELGHKRRIVNNTLAHILTGSAQLPAEQGGIASSILNIAMIPGWPGPTIYGADSKVAMAPPLPNRPMTEAEALTYLAELGVEPGLMEKLRKKLSRFKRGKAVVKYLGTLLKTLGGAFDILAGELASAIEEQQDYAEHRQRADSHGSRYWVCLE